MMMVFESLDRVADDGDPSDPEFSDMTDFPSFDYTTSDVRNAGKIIASDMLWADETEVAIRQAYAVANSWRDSHVIPMRSIRLSANTVHLEFRSSISRTGFSGIDSDGACSCWPSGRRSCD